MSLNVSKAPHGSKRKIEPLAPATYPGRLVQVIDLGLQTQRAYEGKAKEPIHMGYMSYEFSDEFLKDEDGQEMKDKPRWLSERLPIHNLKADLAKSTKRYKALDPSGSHGGDFFKLLGTPAMITIVHGENKKDATNPYQNIGNVAPMRAKDAEKLPPLINKPVAFSLDEPDLEVFLKLAPWLQDVIKSNLEYAGSKLEGMLKGVGQSAPPKAPPVVQESEEEEQPF